MAEGRDRQQWSHLSALIVSVCNANPFRETPVALSDINPYLRSEPIESDCGEIDAGLLAIAICGQQAKDLFAEHNLSKI